MGAEWLQALKKSSQRGKALLLQPEAGEGCQVSCASDCCWVLCSEQGELGMPSPASPPTWAKCPSKAGTAWAEEGECCFYSREVQTDLGCCPWSCERGAKSGPSLAWLCWHSCQQGHHPISSALLRLPGPGLLRLETVPGKRRSVGALGTPCCCSTRSWAAPLLQMLLCRQGGSKDRTDSVQAVVAESELEEIESNQAWGVHHWESSFWQGWKKVAIPKVEKKEGKPVRLPYKEAGKRWHADQAMLTDLV